MKRTEKPNTETLRLRRVFLKQIYRGNRLMFTLAMAAMFLIAVDNLLLSWLMQQIIDVASGADTRLSLMTVVWLCVGVMVLFVLCELLDRYARPQFIKKGMRQYKDYAFSEITKKSISSFSGENTSTYISALSNDALAIETGYVCKMFGLVMQLVMFAGALALMIVYSPELTLVAVVLCVLPVIGSLITGNRLAAAEREVSDKNEGFIGIVKDLLAGFTVIKSFKAELEALRLFAANNEALEEKKRTRRRVEIVLEIIGIGAGMVAQFGVFLFGAYLMQSGRGMTAGVIIMFVQLMNYILTPISAVPQILAGRKAAFGLIDKLAAAVSSNVRREGKSVDNVLDDAIEVKGVSFAYEKDTPVLTEVSLRFEAGRSYAIVGGSGSGKSTLLNLIMGSRDDYEGEILFDGDELRTIGSDSLYDLVSIVQQNVFMFNSTIRDNITLFKDFDGGEVERAARLSGLSELMSERGADYSCGENGVNLSGGERQRISIARCLLRGTPVLLVDEATAALDAATAYAVTSSILDIEGLTRLVVTHRLEDALLRRYDGIIVMRNGQVCETGSFDELMARREYFYSLYTVSAQ